MSTAPVIRDKSFSLALALDHIRMRQHLTSLVQERFGRETEVRKVKAEVMRKRGSRCLIRYFVEVFDLQKHRRFDWRVVGKVYSEGRGQRILQRMQQLWQNGFSRDVGDGLSMPEPFQFSSSLGLLFQEDVPGLPAKMLIKQYRDPDDMRQLARTIAKLHRCQVIPGEPMMLRDHLLRCHPRYPTLVLALPEMEAKIDYIVKTAEKITDKFNGTNNTAIHGDFHLGQVHLENGQAWLVDFDAMSYADPAADVGNVLAFLKSKGWPGVPELVNAFLDEYFSTMDREIASRIPLYEGLTNLRRACKCLRSQEKSWQKRATRYVEQGVACIESLGVNGQP